MLVSVNGQVGPGITAKDIVLAIIGKIGTAGGTGYAIEFGGDAIRALSMEGRMTVCNMAIEAGARAGMVAVDEKTIAYCKGRPYSPEGELWEQAAAAWRDLKSDPDAVFDRAVELDAATIGPQVTWGTSPEMVVTVDDRVPDPAAEPDPVKRSGMEHALCLHGPRRRYTDHGHQRRSRLHRLVHQLAHRGPHSSSPRIEDLRAAAAVVKGKRVAPNVKQALVVPGSGLVKAQAEQEGLHEIFLEAGFEWREAGCSMCLAMNPDRLLPGEHSASTSNRNFEGRQGPGGRSHLVSPPMAAAAAIAGHFVDVRSF